MFGATQITKIRGIPIRIHFTLFLAFLFLILQFGSAGIVAGLILFGSVLAHELGHSVVAQRLGISIAAIDLHLLGGAALMTEQPERPADEIMIAAAGPAVSLIIGAVAFTAAWFTGGTLSLEAPRLYDLMAYAGVVNLGMAIFNLVPALPMDGGRIFRAVLSKRMGPVRATRLAATVARGFAVLFGLGGLLAGSWSLALIGGFVYMLAGQERRNVEARAAWQEQPRAPMALGRWFDHMPGRASNRMPNVTPGRRPTVVDVDPLRVIILER